MQTGLRNNSAEICIHCRERKAEEYQAYCATCLVDLAEGGICSTFPCKHNRRIG